MYLIINFLTPKRHIFHLFFFFFLLVGEFTSIKASLNKLLNYRECRNQILLVDKIFNYDNRQYCYQTNFTETFL